MPDQQFYPYQEPNIYQDPSMIYPDMSLQDQSPYQDVMYPVPDAQPQQPIMYPDYPQEPMMYPDNQPQQPIMYPEVPGQQSMMYTDMQPQQPIMYPEFQQQPIMYPSQSRPNSDWYIPEGAIPEGFEFNDEQKPNDNFEANVQPSVVPYGEQYQNAYGKYKSFYPLFPQIVE